VPEGFREAQEKKDKAKDKRYTLTVMIRVPKFQPVLHYQSFCDHSRNFASVSFEGFKCLSKLTYAKNTESVPLNISYKSFKIYLCKITTVMTETLTV
jgi:hypothetical protein